MKRISLGDWEKKYVAGKIEQFDQKYQMFSRPMWDQQIGSLLKNWSIAGAPRDKPGYALEDQALRWGSNAGTAVSQPGRSPSPPPGSMAEMMTYRLPEGAKTDVSNADKTTLMIKKAARWFGADLVGICELDRRWLYAQDSTSLAARDIPQELQYAVVMAFEMDYGLIRYFNSYTANAATRMGYSRMAVTNAHLASFIRYLGFQAIESGNDIGLSVPMAMQAGLGDIGRNGILITPRYGPRVRLSKVITDLPLIADSPIEFGVTEFCRACAKCADSCPSRSIRTGDRTTETNNVSNNPGALKWPINAETCRTYWSRVTDHARWANPMYIRLDDFVGYGKPRKSDRFWDEWRPGSGYASRR